MGTLQDLLQNTVQGSQHYGPAIIEDRISKIAAVKCEIFSNEVSVHKPICENHWIAYHFCIKRRQWPHICLRSVEELFQELHGPTEYANKNFFPYFDTCGEGWRHESGITKNTQVLATSKFRVSSWIKWGRELEIDPSPSNSRHANTVIQKKQRLLMPKQQISDSEKLKKQVHCTDHCILVLHFWFSIPTCRHLSTLSWFRMLMLK